MFHRESSASIASESCLGDGSAIDNGAEITAPERELAPDELSELRGLIRGTLKLNKCSCPIQAEEDAKDLVNFAVDLITDGLAVILVLEDLDLMEVEICPPASLGEMRVVLASFLGRLHEKDEREDRFKKRRRSVDTKSFHCKRRLQSRLREGDTYFDRFGLSAQASAGKVQDELKSLKVKDAPPRDRMNVFSEGTICGFLQNPDGGGDLNGVADGEDVDPDSFKATCLGVRRLEDLAAIMKDVSLTEKERVGSMKEVMAKYRLMQMKMKIPEACQENLQFARCA